ncbi:MAG: DUF4410 domain-containing protein [Rhodospirillales bacterium]|nr:DUF4410 domain-containing protein [Rhodospirillales bacterium]
MAKFRRFGGLTRTSLLVFAVVAAASRLAGCAPILEPTSTLTPTLVKSPPAQATVLVVGEVAAGDPDAQRWARLLREALIDRLIRADAFSVIYDRDTYATDGSTLLLAGSITQADRGSDAWRFAIGSGIGRPELAGAFELRRREGEVRAAFTIAADEFGPGGLSGHWLPLSMEDMARRLGRDAADAIVRWRHGEEIAAATWP